MSLAPRHALIRGLRRAGSETELTQALGGVFAVEPAMASAFVRLVFGAAPHGERVDLRGLPQSLGARAEVAVAEGRADLSFADVAGRWQVIIEIKIHAGYGPDQIGRYLRSLEGAPRAALAAITRDVPTFGDSAGDDPRWAGSVQWSRLLPGLRALVPRDPDLGAQWPLFLDVLEEEGSMGFTHADEELFRAWAKFPSARAHLVDFLDTLRRAALESLNRELEAAAKADPTLPRTAAEVTWGQAGKVVAARHAKIVIPYKVPAHREGERLWMGLWGWNELRFMVELPYPSPDTNGGLRTEPVEKLLDGGFENWRNRVLTRYLPLDDLLSSPDLQTHVLNFAQQSFRLVAESGVYGLASGSPGPEELTEA